MWGNILPPRLWDVEECLFGCGRFYLGQPSKCFCSLNIFDNHYECLREKYCDERRHIAPSEESTNRSVIFTKPVVDC
jgi:hypothetical protein